MFLSLSLYYKHTTMQGSLQRLALLKREVATWLSVYASRMVMCATCQILSSCIQHFITSEVSDAPSLASSSSPLTYIGRRLEAKQGTTFLYSKIPSTAATCRLATTGDKSCCMTETANSLRTRPCPNILIRDGNPPVAKPEMVAATNVPHTKMQTGLPARVPQLRHMGITLCPVRLMCTIMTWHAAAV